MRTKKQLEKEIEEIENAEEILNKINYALHLLEDEKTREPKGKENIEKWKLVMKEHNKILKRCQYPKLLLVEAKLQTLKDVCEEIKLIIKENEKDAKELSRIDGFVSIRCNEQLNELLKKFQGDEVDIDDLNLLTQVNGKRKREEKCHLIG